MKVSFDFDGTLDNNNVQEFALKLINDGIDVWIHSARFCESEVRPRWNDDIYEVADRLGIPRENIVLTEMYDKFIFFQDRDFIWHLDDSSATIKSITEKTETIGIHYSHYSDDWIKKCNKLIKKRS